MVYKYKEKILGYREEHKVDFWGCLHVIFGERAPKLRLLVSSCAEVIVTQKRRKKDFWVTSKNTRDRTIE